LFIANKLNLPFEDLRKGIDQLGMLTTLDVFVTSMSRAAVFEESIFRGFLLGYLINDRKWNPHLANFGQTLLFWAPHIYQIDNSYAFWIVLPLTGLTYGYVTLLTRSVSPAMFAHGIHEWILNTIRIV